MIGWLTRHAREAPRLGKSFIENPNREMEGGLRNGLDDLQTDLGKVLEKIDKYLKS